MKNKIELINGDCLEELTKLKDNSVDLVLIDPPYGMSYVSNYRKEKYSKIKNDDNLKWLNDFSIKLDKTLKDNSVIYVFCSMHNIDLFKKEFEKKFKLKNILIWEKNNHSAGDLNGSFANKTEFILFFHKGRVLINGKRDINILKFNRTLNKNHPTEKPVDLNEYLISKFSNKNDTVLDCFMGSGSTGVAAKNLNRNFIGIELDENYFEIAKRRIEDE